MLVKHGDLATRSLKVKEHTVAKGIGLPIVLGGLIPVFLILTFIFGGILLRSHT
jgi:hypothetical protein